MRLIVFDLDHTLLTANSSFRFGSFLYKRQFFSFWTLLGCLYHYSRYKWMGMSIYELHTKTFDSLFKGSSLIDIRHYVNQFLTDFLDAMLYFPVVQRLKQAQAQRDHVLILSSAPDFLVEGIATRLQVDHWKATIYQADENGKLIAISQVMEGEDKAKYLKNLAAQMQISSSEITVYSDSYLDLPILKMAGEAIAVRPDSHLKKICLQKGWKIL